MQNITRDIEIKNNQTAEGRREGIMRRRGKGFSGTTIKDTWTKSRGVESGEGSGDG